MTNRTIDENAVVVQQPRRTMSLRTYLEELGRNTREAYSHYARVGWGCGHCDYKSGELSDVAEHLHIQYSWVFEDANPPKPVGEPVGEPIGELDLKVEWVDGKPGPTLV